MVVKLETQPLASFDAPEKRLCHTLSKCDTSQENWFDNSSSSPFRAQDIGVLFGKNLCLFKRGGFHSGKWFRIQSPILVSRLWNLVSEQLCRIELHLIFHDVVTRTGNFMSQRLYRNHRHGFLFFPFVEFLRIGVPVNRRYCRFGKSPR